MSDVDRLSYRLRDAAVRAQCFEQVRHNDSDGLILLDAVGAVIDWMLPSAMPVDNIDQWSGTDVFEFWQPADWPLLRVAFASARSGGSHTLTIKNTPFLGPPAVWDVLLGPFRDDRGRISGFFLRIRDVSVREASVTTLSKRVAELEFELRVKEQQHQRDSGFLHMILDWVDEGVVACDASGRLAMFNRMARIWHGADLRKLSPSRWSEYYDLFEGDGVTPLETESIPLVRAFNGELVENALMSIVRPGCPVRKLLANGGPVRDADGKTVGAVIVMRDITVEQQAILSLEEVLHRYDLTDDTAMETMDPVNRDLFETVAGLIMQMQSTTDKKTISEEFQ